MKHRFTIQIKVTLWFTLLMVLLAVVSLAFLFYVGDQTAQEDTRRQMTAMVEAAWPEIDFDDGRLDIHDDLNISETACTFPSMIPAASRCMARCQGSSTIRWPLPTASCALCRARRDGGMYTTHSARLRAMALCGCAVWRPQTRWIPPFSPCCAWRWCFRFLCCWPLWAGMCWRGALSARCGALRRRRARSAKETICRAALRWGRGAP